MKYMADYAQHVSTFIYLGGRNICSFLHFLCEKISGFTYRGWIRALLIFEKYLPLILNGKLLNNYVI